MTEDSELIADISSNDTDWRAENKFFYRTNLEAGGKSRLKIKFPHLESKVVSPHGEHLSKHITHVIEDNAKFYAEYAHPWHEFQKEKPKPTLGDLSKFYEKMVFWLIIADYFKIEVIGKDEIQDMLDRAWYEVETHPELMKSKCDDCGATKVKV